MCCDVQYHRMSTYIIGCFDSTLQNFGVGESQSVYFCRESAPCGCLSSSLIFICKPEPSRPAEWNCNLLDQKSVSRNLARNIIMIYFKGQWGDSQPNCNMFFFFVFFVFILSPFWNAQLRLNFAGAYDFLHWNYYIWSLFLFVFFSSSSTTQLRDKS